MQPGEKAGVDAPLVSIVDLSRLEVQTQAAVSDVARIALGAPAQVVVEGIGERRFDGRVERINPGAEPGTRSINFFVSLPDQGGLLRVGMFATVFLRVGGARGLPSGQPPINRIVGVFACVLRPWREFRCSYGALAPAAARSCCARFAISRVMPLKMNRCAGTSTHQYDRPHTPAGCQ